MNDVWSQHEINEKYFNKKSIERIFINDVQIGYFIMAEFDDYYGGNNFNVLDEVYVINIYNRDDKRENILNVLQKMKIKKAKFFITRPFFDFVINGLTDKFVGTVITEHCKELKQKGSYRKKMAGNIGCTLSNITCLKDASKNNYKNVLILEDDCELKNLVTLECNSEIVSFILNENYEILYLYCTHLNIEHTLYNNVFIAKKSIPMTHSYIVSKTIIDMFCDYVFDNKNICSYGIDDIFMELYEANKIKCYVILPSLTCQSNLFPTDTENKIILRNTLDKI